MNIDWELLRSSLWPIVQGGLTGTIPLSLAVFAIGLVLALVLALMRLSGNRVVSPASPRAYISVIRGTPLLVQLFVIFYGLPSIGVVLDPWPSAIIAFSLNVGGYAAEVIRAAILSVPKGQWEAGAHDRHGPDRRRCAGSSCRRRPGSSVPPLSNTFISPGQGHLAGLADPGHRAVPRGAGDRGVQPGVHAAVPRGRGGLLGVLPGALGRAVACWRRGWTAMSPTEPPPRCRRRRRRCSP